MKHAITELEVALSTLEHNEPIHRAEGNAEQADECASKAAEIRQALAILGAVEAGPVWPAPSTEPAAPEPPETFKDRIRHALNCCSMENGSDTPDFILADYLLGCLINFDAAVEAREKWYGREKIPVTADEAPAEPDWMDFDRFIQYGIEQGVPTHNGMPWSFKFYGNPVTHETDDKYLISVGTHQFTFERGQEIQCCENPAVRTVQ